MNPAPRITTLKHLKEWLQVNEINSYHFYFLKDARGLVLLIPAFDYNKVYNLVLDGIKTGIFDQKIQDHLFVKKMSWYWRIKLFFAGVI